MGSNGLNGATAKKQKKVLPLGNPLTVGVLLYLSAAPTVNAMHCEGFQGAARWRGVQASLLLFICIIHTTYLNHLDSLPKRLDYFGDNYVT